MALTPQRKRELETAGRRARAAVEARNQAITAARADGASLREIAEAVGLSHMGVRKVLGEG